MAKEGVDQERLVEKPKFKGTHHFLTLFSFYYPGSFLIATSEVFIIALTAVIQYITGIYSKYGPMIEYAQGRKLVPFLFHFAMLQPDAFRFSQPYLLFQLL